MTKKKPIVAMDLSTQGKGGGPYNSTKRIMSSSLKEKFEFREIKYDPTIGGAISIKRILNLVKQINYIKPDIVHFTGLQLSGFHLAIACKICRVKRSLITIRGMSGDSVYFNPIKKNILKYIIEPLTLIMVKRFYSVSDYVSGRGIPKLFSYKSMGSIYNYPPEVDDSICKDEERKKFGFKAEDIVVVSVARINKEKGYHVLEKTIQMFSNMATVKFLIVGQGDYLSTMQTNLGAQVAQGQVVFTGYFAQASKLNFAGDIFVLPTLHETLSVALLEASQAGLALVASNTGGIPEIIEAGKNGILVEPGNERAFYKAIKKLVDDKALIESYGQYAKAKVKKKFCHRDISEKIQGVYNELMEL